MLDIIIVVVIVLITGYIISSLFGAKPSTYLAMVPGLIGIVTVIAALNANRREKIHDLVRGADAMIDIMEEKSIIPVWGSIYGDTNRDEVTALRMLKIAEVANVANDVEKVSNDHNDSWIRTLHQWFESPIIYDAWQKYKPFFQDDTNRLFMRVSM